MNEEGHMETGWSRPKTFKHRITGEIKNELGIFDSPEEFEEIKSSEAQQKITEVV